MDFFLSFFISFRFDIARERSKVIVVVKGEVPPKEKIPENLYNYIQSNTYLSWTDPWFWKKLKYALPHKGAKARCCQPCFVTRRDSYQMRRSRFISQNSTSSTIDLIPMN